jgi:hypothetical protein
MIWNDLVPAWVIIVLTLACFTGLVWVAPGVVGKRSEPVVWGSWFAVFFAGGSVIAWLVAGCCDLRITFRQVECDRTKEELNQPGTMP